MIMITEWIERIAKTQMPKHTLGSFQMKKLSLLSPPNPEGYDNQSLISI